MKFLVDAHLPRRLVDLLREAGHDALHTGDLPLRNRTPDEAINRISRAEQRVVLTKDADFVSSHLRFPYTLVEAGRLGSGGVRENAPHRWGRYVRRKGFDPSWVGGCPAGFKEAPQ
jgi:hypothetical protein